MRGTASNVGTGKIDAIVYRAGKSHPFYVSEHEASFARGPDLRSCLANLSRQVQEDVTTGMYPPANRAILHTFITTAGVTLDLRDGRRKQPFICRIDEVADRYGRQSFEAQCPTNYMRESGRTVADAMARLGDIIAARYEGESVTDLMRELPKRPMLTSIYPGKAKAERLVSALIRRENGGYEAQSLESDERAKGHNPLSALQNLEKSLSEADLRHAPVMQGEPVYCTLDVPLHLKEHVSIRRFFVPVSRYNGHAPAFYASCLPQAGISIRAKTFDEAVEAARDAIALEFREKSAEEVADTLKKPIMLTAARVSVN
ncbi:MAG: hypothetical protein A4E28_02768 [Methanocella sp. PtaU1.Bin125]|nr:MAG: hypothetical protein A4E28_02768 [Methanocella sp. PtaU1.Bin125]